MISFVRPEASRDEFERYRWIGLSYTGPSCGTACRNRWKWKDGSALSYSNWNSAQPRAGRNCALIRKAAVSPIVKQTDPPVPIGVRAKKCSSDKTNRSPNEGKNRQIETETRVSTGANQFWISVNL